MNKKNKITFALIHKILINNYSKSSWIVGIVSGFIWIFILIFTLILNNNVPPYPSTISPDKIIEKYEAQFKSLNTENTQFDVLKKIKFNPIFWENFMNLSNEIVILN